MGVGRDTRAVSRPTRRNVALGPKSAGGFPHEMRDGLDRTHPQSKKHPALTISAESCILWELSA